MDSDGSDDSRLILNRIVNFFIQNKFWAFVILILPFCVVFGIYVIISLIAPSTTSPDLSPMAMRGTQLFSDVSTSTVRSSSLVPRLSTGATATSATVRTSIGMNKTMSDATEKPDIKDQRLEIRLKILRDLVELQKKLRETTTSTESQTQPPDEMTTAAISTTDGPDTTANEDEKDTTETSTKRNWKQMLDEILPQLNR